MPVVAKCDDVQLRNRTFRPQTAALRQVFYTLDVSQYAIGKRASDKDNFYHCINKALQKREPQLLGKLSGQVSRAWLLEQPRCLHYAVPH